MEFLSDIDKKDLGIDFYVEEVFDEIKEKINLNVPIHFNNKNRIILEEIEIINCYKTHKMKIIHNDTIYNFTINIIPCVFNKIRNFDNTDENKIIVGLSCKIRQFISNEKVFEVLFSDPKYTIQLSNPIIN